jgi:hypothetical protein
VPKLEHVSELDRRRHVADAEVVARATVNPDRDADHGGIVTPGKGLIVRIASLRREARFERRPEVAAAGPHRLDRRAR